MATKPLGDRVLLQLKKAEEKTASGLFVPATAQEKTNRGIVLAVGEDPAIHVKEGDEVIYDLYAGTKLKENGEDCVILHFADLIAVVRNS